jgi:hypothetical protein
MGYDMYIVDDQPEAEKVAQKAAQEEFDAAVAARNLLPREDTAACMEAQAKVEVAYEALMDSQTNYFRLNIWGMGMCRGFMAERGMVYNGYGGWPSWPDYEEPVQRDGESDENFAIREQAYEDQHSEATKPVQSYHPPGGHTIPAMKFSDNSGWLVTPAECEAALNAAALYSGGDPVAEDGEVVQWWPSWISYLERAAKRGGFRVY